MALDQALQPPPEHLNSQTRFSHSLQSALLLRFLPLVLFDAAFGHFPKKEIRLVAAPSYCGRFMSEYPPCPECDSEYAYESGPFLTCPDCGHEWNPDAIDAVEKEDPDAVKDAHGNILQSGDTVKLTRDLKVKGTSSTLKIGTKVKNIRLVENSDGHNIDCKVDGIGQMKLKSEFVKKD